MDNRREYDHNEPFYNETNNIHPSINRQSRQRNQFRSQTTTDEDIASLYDFMTEYNENIRIYQNNMRQHQDITNSFLSIINALSTRERNSRNRASQNNATNNHRQYYNSTTNPSRFTNWSNSIYTNIVNDVFLRNIDQIFPSTTEDVVVRPTEAQFNAATRTFSFSAAENISATHCPITLEDFQEEDVVCQIIHCGHCFKEDAIKNWFQRKVRCPVCRYDIRDYVQPESQTSSDTDALPPVDLSRNEVPRQPPRRAAPIDTLVRSLSNGLSSILQNYLDEGTNSSNNDVVTFEIPVVFYNDISGNGIRFQNLI